MIDHLRTGFAWSMLFTFVFVVGNACTLSCAAPLLSSNETKGVNQTAVATTSSSGEGEEDTESTVRQSWAVLLITLVAAVINSKASMLWAESRMLRKLNSPNRGEVEWVESVKQSMPQQDHFNFEAVFANSVITLSKGRHTRFGRLYSHIYLAFTVSIDLIVFAFDTDVILTSDVVIAFRLLIYSGALSVMGAYQFRRSTYCFIFGPPTLFAVLVITDGIVSAPKPSWAHLVPTVLLWISIAWDAFLAVKSIGPAFTQDESDMFSITDRILKGKSVTESQQKYMDGILKDADIFKTRKGKYWRISLFTWFKHALHLLVGFAIILYDISPSQRPYVFVLDTFEMLAETLFIINDTQVAPTLFEELLNRVHRQIKASANQDMQST